MGALTIDPRIINLPGVYGLWALGGGGLFALLIVLVLLANLTGRARLWALVPSLIGLVALELALYLVRKQTMTLGKPPQFTMTFLRFSEESRFWSFVGQVSIPIAFLLAARA